MKWHVLSFIIQRPFEVFGFLNFTYSRAQGIYRIAALKLYCAVLLSILIFCANFYAHQAKGGTDLGALTEIVK